MDSIGTLSIENTAYKQAWIFSWMLPLVTIVFSFWQYVCFHFYNEKYHPMVIILEESKTKGGPKFKTYKLATMMMKHLFNSGYPQIHWAVINY